MAAVWPATALAKDALSGTAKIAVQDIAGAPFDGKNIPVQLGKVTVPAGTAAAAGYTLTPTMLATYPIITIDKGAQTATQVVLLPAPADCAGIRIKFVLNAVIAQILSITSTGANVNGIILQNAITAPIRGLTTVSFSATAVVGDSIEYVSNGVTWNCTAMSSVAAGITAA